MKPFLVSLSRARYFFPRRRRLASFRVPNTPLSARAISVRRMGGSAGNFNGATQRSFQKG